MNESNACPIVCTVSFRRVLHITFHDKYIHQLLCNVSALVSARRADSIAGTLYSCTLRMGLSLHCVPRLDLGGQLCWSLETLQTVYNRYRYLQNNIVNIVKCRKVNCDVSLVFKISSKIITS